MSNTATLASETAPAAVTPQPRSIVVADRGHVWVGVLISDGDPDFLRIAEARVIRRWGTTEGLNQLATKGPQPNTKLDAPATVLVAKRAVIAVIPCEPAAWTA